MPYKAKGKCVHKVLSGGKLSKEPVGCTKGDVKKYLGALYANDPKVAKDNLKEIIEAFNVGKRKDELMAEMTEMHNNVKGMYETMTHEGYEDTFNEMEKMHNEMKRLYAEIAKLEK
jgi:hypothetical protein